MKLYLTDWGFWLLSAVKNDKLFLYFLYSLYLACVTLTVLTIPSFFSFQLWMQSCEVIVWLFYIGLSLLFLCSWGAPSTKHSALRKAPKHTLTLRKLPPPTPQLLTLPRCLMKGEKEETACCLPWKPQLQPPPLCEYTTPTPPHSSAVQFSSMKISYKGSLAFSRIMESTEEGDSEESAVSELRSELWVKERELTDIRLEALDSAHQLEQLRDAMKNMQVCFAYCTCLCSVTCKAVITI